MCQAKYASAVPKNLGVGVDFRPCSEGNFLTGRPQSVALWPCQTSQKNNLKANILNHCVCEGVTSDPHDFIVEQVALHNTRSLTGKDTDHRGAIKVNGGDENVSVGRGNDVVINTHLCMLLSFYSWLLPCVPENLLYSKITLKFLRVVVEQVV